VLPQTDQAKFFQKKRDEDEQKLRDKGYENENFEIKNFNFKNKSLPSQIDKEFDNQNHQNIYLYKIASIEQNKVSNHSIYSLPLQISRQTNIISIKGKKKKFFKKIFLV